MTNSSSGTPIVRVKKEHKEMGTLMKCELGLNIASATAAFTWTGPKINPPTWWQILAFFEWTYAEEKSESQVRLFVNENEWRAHAFPQKRGTGMTANELPDHEHWAADRAQFPDTEGWWYYGTVHHHCGGGAFQSGTDEHNEKDQDGLHITVGHVGRAPYDLHCRLYQSGWKLSGPDMGDFWDIGPLAKSMIPDNMHDLVARHQMCQPIPDNAAIIVPERWKENYIRPVVIPTTSAGYGMGTTGSSHTVYHSNGGKTELIRGRHYLIDPKDRKPPSTSFDLKEAASMFLDYLIANQTTDVMGLTADELEPDSQTIVVSELDFATRLLERLSQSPICCELIRLMWLKELEPGDFAEAITEEELRREKIADQVDEWEERQKERTKERLEEAEKARKDKERIEEEQARQLAEGGWHGC